MGSPTPFKAIVVGISVGLLSGYYTGKLFIAPDPDLSKDEIIFVKGVVDHADEMKVPKKATTLEIWLRGEKLPFRSSGPYPLHYNQNTMSLLQPGAAVIIGILPAEQHTPRMNYIQNQPFRNIYTLEANGVVAFSLDDYNRWTNKNTWIGRFVAPAILACSIGVLIWGLNAKRKKTTAEIPCQIR
jgi:hypothetical protein